jgi:hypothetical protein
MRFDFLDRRSAERFAELLDDRSGVTRHNAGELADLVAISHTLSAAPPKVHVEPEFRTGLRAMLLATAERDGIGATATAPIEEAGAHAGVREPRVGLLRSGSGRRIRVRGAIVISVAAGAMAVSGISAASENASPGDALYGVKRSTERAQLAMAGSDVTRGQLSLDFARTRLTEATAMDGDDTAFAGVLDDMDADTRQGVKLLTGSAVTRKDAAPLGTVDGFVTAQRNTMLPIVAKLGPDNRERAQASLDLLDAVHQRADDLRAGLSCANIVPDGADSLGPKLTECSSGKGSATSPDHSRGIGEKQGTKSSGSGSDDTVSPERTGPAVKPGVSGQAVPNPAGPGIAPSSPATGESPGPADGNDHGVLGGILGGILGG